MRRVYWANGLFSMADRDFNEKWVRFLRARGFEVFNPQEQGFNSDPAVIAAHIFHADFSEIASADVVVACLDHESIDAGVACEIGCAYALSIPVVGLITDVRRHRIGEGKVYKNLFVMGCVRNLGEVVGSPEDIPDAIDRVTKTKTRCQ